MDEIGEVISGFQILSITFSAIVKADSEIEVRCWVRSKCRRLRRERLSKVKMNNLPDLELRKAMEWEAFHRAVKKVEKIRWNGVSESFAEWAQEANLPLESGLK